jgi:hypothetical protein
MEKESLLYFAEEIIDLSNTSLNNNCTKQYMIATLSAIKTNAQTIKNILKEN